MAMGVRIVTGSTTPAAHLQATSVARYGRAVPRHTAATELLGIELPILQAPMLNAATPELAAAVSEVGGLGALGSAMLSVEELRREAAAVRELTDRPFQLNFFCHPPPEVGPELAARAREHFAALYAELDLGEPPEPEAPELRFDEARLEALLEIRPAVVSFHFGMPAPEAVAAIRDAGMPLLATATTVAEALQLEQAGVDAVVAQGSEAGGHRGSFLVDGDDGPVGTLALVPQVVDAVSVPVIAAGGIADARQLAAVLALGAGAAQIGTAFLACPESGISDVYREALRTAQAEATTLSRSFSGRPARVLANRVTRELEAVLPYPAQLSLTMPLRGILPAGDPGAFQPLFAGQSAALARAAPAGEVARELAGGADELLGRLGRGERG
jgi:nitronate monooxygenase